GFPAPSAPRPFVRTRGRGEGRLRCHVGPAGPWLPASDRTPGLGPTGHGTARGRRNGRRLPACRTLAGRGPGIADCGGTAAWPPAAVHGFDPEQLPAIAPDGAGLRTVAALRRAGPHSTESAAVARRTR